MPIEISQADILDAVRATGTTKSFCSNQTYLTKRLGRKPNRLERLVLTNTLKELDKAEALLVATDISQTSDEVSVSSDVPAENILICTAYSADYTIGGLCELVNKEYANTHG